MAVVGEDEGISNGKGLERDIYVDVCREEEIEIEIDLS